jgi:hypothetical protein
MSWATQQLLKTAYEAGMKEGMKWKLPDDLRGKL